MQIKPRNTLLISLIIICCLVVLSIFLIKTKLAFKMWYSLVLDSKEHFLTCDELPSVNKVMQVMNERQNILQKIENIDPKSVSITMGIYNECVDKSDILISYLSHQDRLEIEKIINGKTFFGVPYRLQNQ